MSDPAQLTERFTDVMAKFTAFFGKRLPDDVLEKLEAMRRVQKSELATLVYDAMFTDLEMAKERNVPFCQDTGVIQYHIELGADFPIRNELEACLKEAVRRATVKAPLRHNAVQIFDEKNTGDNTGHRIPWIDLEIVPNSSDAVIYAYMAGGGCSLPGTAKVLMPVEGYEAVVQFIFDTICERGVNACPLLVGVGIAGSVEVAATLSKRALMRPVGSHNPNKRAAEFERMVEEGLNRINIGPGGLTGEGSVMGVNVEAAARHPSCLAVGVSVGCWGHRRGAIRIHSDMSYELLSYKGGYAVKTHHLTTPIKDVDLEGIEIGDIVYLSGYLITSRDDVHMRLVKQHRPLPVDLAGKAIFHAGPIMVPCGDESGSGYKVVSIGPTTSMRMEKFEREFIRDTGVKIIVGKGGMGPNTEAGCRDHKALHCVWPGGCAVLAASKVEEVEEHHWEELGMPESIWVMRVKDFGPMIVSIDTKGQNLFEKNKKVFNEKKQPIVDEINKHVDYFD